MAFRAVLALLLGAVVFNVCAMPADPDDTSALELAPLQVTATRLPQPVQVIPASISVITGEELASRNARDLRSALALTAGVDIAPGGDGGPSSAVPGFWGLREFDAYLLVVDGVPWGGAFNPALASLTLTDIDRIEILRGAAPVMYGATSFVGVIHVIHHPAGQSDRFARVSYGSFDSASVSGSVSLPAGQRFAQSLAVDGERTRFSDERAAIDRGHVLYRGGFATRSEGHAHFDVDLTRLRQKPTSPHLREGSKLAPGLPLDANHNPSDARLDEDRYHLVAGFDRPLGDAKISTLVAFTSTADDIIRGFVDEEFVDDGSTPNAFGFVQDRDIKDVYADSHMVLQPLAGMQLTMGIDYLYGKARQTSENFDYFISSSGVPAPNSALQPVSGRFHVRDERKFIGVYMQAEYGLAPGVVMLAGIRLNRTEESRRSKAAGEAEGDFGETDEDKLERSRPSGMIGMSWRAWQSGPDFLTLFADYRDTFKPAAIDFGPESEAGILKPETASSVEAGIKAAILDGRLRVDLSVFDMHFENLVVKQALDGRPGLANAGEEHFEGAEIEADMALSGAWLLAGSYAWHEARFGDYVQLFGDTPAQLHGHFLEMSPEHVAGLGLLYRPEHGLHGSLTWEHVGRRFLNKRNTARAPSYDTLDASLGWRFRHWDLSFIGSNLTNERPPVSESELGESQYYRLPARSLEMAAVRLF